MGILDFLLTLWTKNNFWENFRALKSLNFPVGRLWRANFFRTVWKLYRLSGIFLDCPKTFQTVRKFPDCLENVHTFRILLTLPGNFPDCPETFSTAWKLSRLSGNFFNCLENFLTLQKPSGLSGNFFNYLESFHTVRNLFRLMSFYLFLGPIF